MINSSEASKIINSLRNGTAPILHAEKFIVGRDRELEEYNRCIEAIKRGESSVKIITGDYGAGKSHLVNAMKNIAVNRDYIISSFQINKGFRLNKIEDLYYAIMHNLYLKNFSGSNASFNDIFDLWIENLNSSPFPDRKRIEINAVCQELASYSSNFARSFLMFMRSRIQKNQEMQNVTTAWLTGEKNIPFELKQKYDLVGFVDKTNTIDFLKAFSRLATLLGYNGLIIFIDELDQVLEDRRDIRISAYNNLKHLIDLTSSGEMTNTLFVFSGIPELLSDSERGFPSLKSLSQRIDLENSKNGQNLRQNLMPLSSIQKHQIIELLNAVVRIYSIQSKFKEKLPSSEILFEKIELTEDKNTRQYIIDIIRMLDYFEENS